MNTRAIATATPRSAAAPPAPVLEVLAEYRRTQDGIVRLWSRSDDGWSCVHAVGESPGPEPDGAVVPVEGPLPLWLEVTGRASARADAEFLAAVVSRMMRQDAEAREFGREIGERYEEITLLYSISEILGSVISLEQATATILEEVADVLGVRRATLWIHDEQTGLLELIAAVGGDGQQGPIAAADDVSVTAAVFRSRRPVILAAGEEYPREGGVQPSSTRGSFLSVPVSYTPPDGATRTIGVINLVGRDADETFSAGDQKLISAIASQIGAAVENSRLIAASLRQERMDREMELAHDLQLKLLPSVEQFRGYAEVAARCAPADSVGGDFYQLFRLPNHRLGVMIGDVSSHGFGAALIMALTMSAAAIHASEGDSPGQVLRRAHQTLIDELETTEMYLTLFYGVIDPAAGTLVYSNAGHSHAFSVDASGATRRLGATNPPFGIVDLDDYGEETVPWAAESDLLFLFTDGLSDSLGLGEVGGVDRLVEEVREARHLPADAILRRLFALPAGPADTPADDRTALLVRI